MTDPSPCHPVGLAPSRSVTFFLDLDCGVPDAPPPPWREHRESFLDPDEKFTVVGDEGPSPLLFRVVEIPEEGDTPARVTV
jgi:hypothetical protein